jgi:hypothetical protein
LGALMLSGMSTLPVKDHTEWIPAFLTIVLMSFTFNIGVGMTAGLLSYPVLKLFTGRVKEVSVPMWWLAALSLLFYAVYLLGSLVLLQSFGLGWPLWFAMEIAAFKAMWHFGLIYKREREGCFKAFRMNHWLGATVFAGVVWGLQLRAQLLS